MRTSDVTDKHPRVILELAFPRQRAQQQNWSITDAVVNGV